jgi:hypothetical protein
MQPDASATSQFAAGLAKYVAGDWPSALTLFQQIGDQDPVMAARSFVPLLVAHCRIELAPPDALETLELGRGATGDDRLAMVVKFVRARAQELCRAGDHARAARLLDALADYDGVVAETLASCRAAAPPPSEPIWPSFPTDPTLSAPAIAGAKQRFAQTRVLIVFRQLFAASAHRAHDPFDNLRRSAERFGLIARAVNSHGAPPGLAEADYAPWLQGEILAFRPHIILYDDLFETGLSADDARLGEQVGAVLQNVRALLGVRVVKCLIDAWRVIEAGADRPLRGLDECVDLLFHQHPMLLMAQSEAERRRSFCFLLPFELPPPNVPMGTIPRACFAGSVVGFNLPRLVWWAEIGKRALPLDFFETVHGGADERSDQAYANLLHRYQLSVNLTQRPNGVRIVTGKTIEVPLSAGVLLEEDSVNSAYFLARGTHYEGFTTFDGLAALIDDLLRSETRRKALARAGQAWVQEQFSGDRFWAGLLARLFA